MPCVLPSCSSRHLRHHLIGSFVTPEIGNVHCGVGIQYTHHFHTVEVQSFRDHLCAYQYVGIAVSEIRQNGIVCRASASGVEVKAGGFCIGKHSFHIGFNLFRAYSVVSYVCASAFGASGGHCVCCAAVMAGKTLGCLMIGEAYVAFFALGNPSAVATFEIRSVSSAVLKQNDLLVCLECFLHFAYKFGR